MEISALCFLFKVSFAPAALRDVRGRAGPCYLCGIYFFLCLLQKDNCSWFKDPSEVVCFRSAQHMASLTPAHICQPKTWFVDSAYLDFPSFQCRLCMGQAGGTPMDRISAAWSTSAPSLQYSWSQLLQPHFSVQTVGRWNHGCSPFILFLVEGRGRKRCSKAYISWVNALKACKANKSRGQYSGLDELVREAFTWHMPVWPFPRPWSAQLYLGSRHQISCVSLCKFS